MKLVKEAYTMVPQLPQIKKENKGSGFGKFSDLMKLNEQSRLTATK